MKKSHSLRMPNIDALIDARHLTPLYEIEHHFIKPDDSVTEKKTFYVKCTSRFDAEDALISASAYVLKTLKWHLKIDYVSKWIPAQRKQKSKRPEVLISE